MNEEGRNTIQDFKALPGKLKTLLGALLAVALLVVFRISGFVGTHLTANISGSLENGNSGVSAVLNNPPPLMFYDNTADKDGDGLEDTEENALYKASSVYRDTDGDGFIDGEEVITGYNPRTNEKVLAANTGINFNMNSKNLTTALISRLGGGILSGDISLKNIKDEQTEENLKFVVLTTMDEAGVPAASFSNTLPARSSQADKELYLEEFTKIARGPINAYYYYDMALLSLASRHLINGETAKANKTFGIMSRLFSRTYNELMFLKVPRDFSKNHRQIAGSLLTLSDSFNKITQSDNDPVLALKALSRLGNSSLELAQQLNAMKKAIEKQGIIAPDFFK